MQRLRFSSAGFTLIELMLVITVISILSGIVIVSINPGESLNKSGDAKRRSDLKTLLDANYQYFLDHNQFPRPNNFPSVTDFSRNEICTLTGTTTDDTFDCLGAGKFLFGDLVPDYLGAIPVDPDHDVETDPLGSSYFIWLDDQNRLYLNAPLSETEDDLEVSR